MKSSPEEVLRELLEMAEHLANWKCPYMAGTLLQYYDGDFAAETKDARVRESRKYFDQAQALAEQKYAPPKP